jgi:hypothetical protein
MMSFPACPLRRSWPAPPSIQSLPAPPSMMLLPPPPADGVVSGIALDAVRAIGPDDDVVAQSPAQDASVRLAVVRASDNPAVPHVDGRGEPVAGWGWRDGAMHGVPVEQRLGDGRSDLSLPDPRGHEGHDERRDRQEHDHEDHGGPTLRSSPDPRLHHHPPSSLVPSRDERPWPGAVKGEEHGLGVRPPRTVRRAAGPAPAQSRWPSPTCRAVAVLAQDSLDQQRGAASPAPPRSSGW